MSQAHGIGRSSAVRHDEPTMDESNSPTKTDRPLDTLVSGIKDFKFDNELAEQVARRPFERQTWRETLYLLSTIPAGIAAGMVWLIAGSIGLALVFTIIGIPLLIFAFWIFRHFAGLERRRVAIVDDRPIQVAYQDRRSGILAPVVDFMKDAQTWKDAGWMVFVSTIGLGMAATGLAAWLVAFGWILYPLWGWSMPGDATPLAPIIGDDTSLFETFLVIPLGLGMVIVAAWLCAAITYVLVAFGRVCLGSSDERFLRERVTRLEHTREQTLTQQSTTMSRIERDLHDGAQARLVALAMDLGMAEEKIEEDPEAARKLVAEARDEAQRTLQDLRDLVRGIGPQILRDRGLEAALMPIASRSPIDVAFKIELDERPSERIESVAYFVTSEALANAIKHSEAEKINVNVWRNDEWLYLRVSDNGRGGASIESGEGLSGLEARIGAVDGRLMIDSPAGGPTIIDAWLPFE